MPTASISDAALANPEKRQNPGGGGLYQIKLQKNPQDEYIYDDKRHFEFQSKNRYTNTSRFVNHVEFTMKFGQKTSLRIPNDHDILGKCHLEVVLPVVQSETGTGTWHPDIAKLLLKKHAVKFGEQILFSTERLYSDIVEKVACTYSKTTARNLLRHSKTQSLDSEHLLFIPLDLFDLRSTGKNHFIPTYFVNNDRLVLEMIVEDFDKCVQVQSGRFATVNEISAKFVYETSVIDPIDRNHLLYTPQTFLVDKIADSESTTDLELSDGSVTTVHDVTVRLNEINFPVSFLVFVAYESNTVFEYLDIIKSYALFLDGNERIRVMDIDENNVQKYENFRKNSGENIGVIPFSTYSSSRDPSGFCDFSKFKTKELKFQLKRKQAGVTIKVFAVGFSFIRYQSGQIGMAFDD